MENFYNAIRTHFPQNDELTRPMIVEVGNVYNMQKEAREFIADPNNKVKWGVYRAPRTSEYAAVELAKPMKAPIPTTKQIVQKIADADLIPENDKDFVSFGDFPLLKKIISSGSFFPVYISGESGNGKTKMVYQACAVTKRELIRANITESTDEDDLVGGFRILNGETVWQDGPAIEAMKRGAILLLDEINLASPKIMCLQPILEGNPIYVKKTNTVVHPAPGFSVIATANTKGKASDDGRYIGSNTLNEALLDRFAVTIEHDYPGDTVEIKILTNILDTFGANTPENTDFITKLVAWAKVIRETYLLGGVDELITTRRLIHTLKFHLLTGTTRAKAIKYTISRFDEDTKKAFQSLYQKVDDTIKITSDGAIVD